MTNRLRAVKKRLSRCEKFLADGVRATEAGDPDRMERRFDRDFARPLRDLVAVLARGGMRLPPRELGRLLRIETVASRAADRPTVTEDAIREALAAEAAESGVGTDRAVVTRHPVTDPFADEAVLAAFLALSDLPDGLALSTLVVADGTGNEATGEEIPESARRGLAEDGAAGS